MNSFCAYTILCAHFAKLNLNTDTVQYYTLFTCMLSAEYSYSQKVNDSHFDRMPHLRLQNNRDQTLACVAQRVSARVGQGKR